MKGDFNGQCEVYACENNPATFYNFYTQKYYCGSCARRINDENHLVAKRKLGHKLCIPVTEHFDNNLSNKASVPVPEDVVDWRDADENGVVRIPDELDPLVNSVHLQLQIHLQDGSISNQAIVNIVWAAQKYFQKNG